MARRNPRSRDRVSLADFEETGRQDCANVMSIDDFNLGDGTAQEIVEAAWRRWESDPGFREHWFEQNLDTFDELDPVECYLRWRAGWQQCAIREVERALARRRPEDEED